MVNKISKSLEKNRERENRFFPLTSVHPATMHCPLPPVLSSSQAGWKNIYLEFHRQPAGEIPQSYCQKYSLCIKTTTSTKQSRSVRWLNDQFQDKSMARGEFFIVPPETCYRGRWDSSIDFILLSLEPSLVRHTAYETVDPDLVEIEQFAPKADPFVLQLGLALETVLRNNQPDSSLYAETMANALSVHLLQYYSVRKFTFREYADGLPQHKLKRVIDRIHGCLEQNLSVSELADLVQISPHYFGRLFKQSMGIAPYQYILQCRVEQSKKLLRDDRLSLAEIAQTVGFAHQSHLNYHFKRLVRVTPKQFRDR